MVRCRARCSLVCTPWARGIVPGQRIAKEAGVGSATLYRNFPTREALIAAAYQNELARLCDAAPELLAALPPRDALRAWMSRLIEYTTAKFGMAEALRSVLDSGVNPYADSPHRVMAAIEALLAAGAARPDVTAAEVFTLLTGIALALDRTGQPDRAERLLDLALTGLTAEPPP
ncbi:putative TetR-family transcriptional regulator [Actinoplanes missouriensis 431]|uniref:Putative TetR-family transcriptional regulator n=1 Tax=Actinoplanes missouriensis (strain ATCC 14538 / DSM 43046 / CBS 188.64 / JCM 3121 / NBRC 102363 / NCIMB 12654 / NRRL B-3342 / UNCC 431) TaxID=512565 RepID=I0HJL6_ACTM4|nr:TetR/AcrR family transcriptional regulator [Actinoplanes missouriensis]BAL93203.1 putative TetR-family transcriptional regulator [Actinoplanes missouriensis 431]